MKRIAHRTGTSGRITDCCSLDRFPDLHLNRLHERVEGSLDQRGIDRHVLRGVLLPVSELSRILHDQLATRKTSPRELFEDLVGTVAGGS